MAGFKWRRGRERETLGIWMWSEVFTHDYENGDKVAIILLDTQGCFDDKSSARDCSTIFALSTMLSSVQCYNLMHQIREDDLRRLQFFTEYGELVLAQTNKTAFQELMFILRDWPNQYEMSYGLDSGKLINETLAISDEQTPEMHQLRKGISSSFEKITAFLMPYPGMEVAQGNSFDGDLRLIDADFIKYVKELALTIFAPENLIVKQINGQNVQARDFLRYLKAYMNVFNGDKLPDAKTVLMVSL